MDPGSSSGGSKESLKPPKLNFKESYTQSSHLSQLLNNKSLSSYHRPFKSSNDKTEEASSGSSSGTELKNDDIKIKVDPDKSSESVNLMAIREDLQK